MVVHGFSNIIAFLSNIKNKMLGIKVHPFYMGTTLTSLNND